MRLFHSIVFLLGFMATSVTAQGTFPTVTSKNLNGTEVTLPRDLPGEPTIVFVAYKQDQQDDVNTWVNALGLDPARGAAFVEIPVVGRGASLMRGIIDNGMRKGIPDVNMRGRTITLYESPSVINGPLGFTGTDSIRVMVVRRNGQVLWSTSGAATSDGVNALKSAFK